MSRRKKPVSEAKNSPLRQFTFARRFRAFDVALTDALPVFSSDLVGVVLGYAVCGVPKPDAKPTHLLSIDLEPQECVKAISINPEGSQVWVSIGCDVQVRSTTDGSVLFKCDQGGFEGYYGVKQIAFDIERQEVFMAAFAADLVLVYRFDGSLARTFSVYDPRGLGHRHYNSIAVVQIKRKPHVLVGNIERVYVLEPDGEFVDTWCGPVRSDNVQWVYPNGLAVSPNGKEVFVSSEHAESCGVQVYDLRGRLLRTFGSKGEGPGQFTDPTAICCDAESNVFVVDEHAHSVKIFQPNGTFVTQFGSKGYHDGAFYLPQCVAVDNDGRIWVGDMQARLHVFGFPV